MVAPSSALHRLSSEMTSWSFQSEFLVVRCFVSARMAHGRGFLIFILVRGCDVSCGTFLSLSLALFATSSTLDVSVREFTTSCFQEKTIKAMRRRERGQTWSWNITTDMSYTILFPSQRVNHPLHLVISFRRPVMRSASISMDIMSIRAGKVYTDNADPVNSIVC